MQSNDHLSNLSKEELLARWSQLPGKQPPPHRVDRLRRELAYREQEQEYGRLDKNTSVSLSRHMAEFGKSLRSGLDHKPSKTSGKIYLESGAVLTRQWEGKTVTVQVIGLKQFEYGGSRFKSLSAVAKAITGQHVSGPLFFGLKEVSRG